MAPPPIPTTAIWPHRRALVARAPSRRRPKEDERRPPGLQRDVALDLLRGLAMVILVVNHIHLNSLLEYGTEPFLSAAEALVLVSGIVCGIVFRRRWEVEGPYAVTLVLLHRARRLYFASVFVVAIVGALRY